MREYTETELWHHGQDRITLFHVFGLVALEKNVVVAFAEAREGSGGDSNCAHSVWMRRSTDGGKTFEPSVCVAGEKGNRCLTDPTPVYDREIGRLFLFYSENDHEESTRNYMMFSDDQGKSWSEEKDMTREFSFAGQMPVNITGPGHGIQIKGGSHHGRLILPFWHRKYSSFYEYDRTERPPRERGYCLSVLYSDDHGKSWSQSGYTGYECMGNESCIGQTAKGLIRSIRAGGEDPQRYVSFSEDDGVTWSQETPMAIPLATTCQAGLLCFGHGEGHENMVLVSRVSGEKERKDMEILISYDGGLTFPGRMQLPPGDAIPGYSDMCLMEEETPVIGLLHCRNNRIWFSRISLNALTDENQQ